MDGFKTPVKAQKIPDSGDKIVIPPSPFLNRLGYGTGVNVMQLVRSPCAGQVRSPWALKMINKRVKPCEIFKDRLKAEADILKQMSHPNIVGFRAFSKADQLCLGMEACDVSLGDMIEKKVEDYGNPFEPLQIIKVALDIGKALDYLHTKVKILHGDIKSYNVLINGDFAICKLCDFGVTLPLDENGVFDKEKGKNLVYYGTEAWSAPEVIHGGEISSKTDIWPLGLTFWEMMSLSPPHINDVSMDESMSLDDSCASEMFNENYGTRTPVPANIDEFKYASPLALFCCCTEKDPEARPPASDIAAVAHDMMVAQGGKVDS